MYGSNAPPPPCAKETTGVSRSKVSNKNSLMKFLNANTLPEEYALSPLPLNHLRRTNTLNQIVSPAISTEALVTISQLLNTFIKISLRPSASINPTLQNAKI